MRGNYVKARLAEGGLAFGTMVFEFATPGIARLANLAGAEFVIYDMEHSGFTLGDIKQLLATRHGDVIPMVRVPTLQYHLLAGPLDAGAMGLMVPMVEDADQAALIVRSSKYHPEGGRGTAFGMAHDEYDASDVPATMASSNAEGFLIAQIETVRGLENAEAIAGVPGIDCLWVGHFDLTQSMGIPAQFGHPDFIAALDRVVAACEQHGKTAGILATNPADAERWIARGFRAIAYGVDTGLYVSALREGLSDVRRRVRQAPV